VTGSPSTVTRRTISYLTCAASRASKNPSARNAGSVTCPGWGFRHRDARSAVTFGSSADPGKARRLPVKTNRKENYAEIEQPSHHDTPQNNRKSQDIIQIYARETPGEPGPESKPGIIILTLTA
jgi:hypothetical protein